MNNHKITNLATPTASTDAATKGYVDASSGGTLVCSYQEHHTTAAWQTASASCPVGQTIVSAWSYAGTSQGCGDYFSAYSGCVGDNTCSRSCGSVYCCVQIFCCGIE